MSLRTNAGQVKRACKLWAGTANMNASRDWSMQDGRSKAAKAGVVVNRTEELRALYQG